MPCLVGVRFCPKYMKQYLATIATISVLSGLSSSGATVALWTFEGITGVTAANSPTVLPVIGTGSAKGVHASASTVWSNPAGNGSAGSLSATIWAVGDYWQIQTSTIGFKGITLSYDQTGSSTGPRDFSLSYSLNGTSFITVGSTYSILQNGLAPNASWSTGTPTPAYGFSVDLTAIGSIEDAASVFFRITDMATVSLAGGTVGSGGTSRIDNFLVSGTIAPIPEPSTWALFGAGVIGLVFVVRRKNK